MFNFFNREGMPQDINAQKFEEIRKAHPNHKIIDVRTAWEFNEGYIEGAILMDLQNGSFQRGIAHLDKEDHYLIYCRSGNRSGVAGRIMSAQGFTNVYNLAGGIMRWPYQVVH